MILDSTFLHDLIREDSDAVDRLDELIAEETPIAISSLTVVEVGVGLRGTSEQYREQFRAIVDDLEESPFGPPEARAATAIQRSLYDRGEPIGAVDALIAATVSTSSDPRVLTRNVDEFERVDVINVESY